MEPVVGVEPTTDGLQNRCSTTELNWQSPGRTLRGGGAAGKRITKMNQLRSHPNTILNVGSGNRAAISPPESARAERMPHNARFAMARRTHPGAGA